MFIVTVLINKEKAKGCLKNLRQPFELTGKMGKVEIRALSRLKIF
jgi:hypothetical protein